MKHLISILFLFLCLALEVNAQADECQNASVLNIGTFLSVKSSTPSDTSKMIGCNQKAPDTWYQFVAMDSMMYLLNMKPRTTFGSNIEFSIYEGKCDSNLTCIQNELVA